MQQRRVRLGDILDDYCPRERRITNHAVVAMIDDTVKQTRCTTCDAEHVYKGGKAPRRRKAASTGALYKEVLAGIEEPIAGAPRHAAPPREPVQPVQPEQVESADMNDSDSSPESLTPETVVPETLSSHMHDPDIIDDDSQARLLPRDEGPVHRPLIRAQLPRPEGIKIERPAPEFTIRQNNARGGFRGRHGGGNSNSNGNAGHRFGRGPHRGGSGRGPNQGFGRNSGGGRKRGR